MWKKLKECKRKNCSGVGRLRNENIGRNEKTGKNGKTLRNEKTGRNENTRREWEEVRDEE